MRWLCSIIDVHINRVGEEDIYPRPPTSLARRQSGDARVHSKTSLLSQTSCPRVGKKLPANNHLIMTSLEKLIHTCVAV